MFRIFTVSAPSQGCMGNPLPRLQERLESLGYEIIHLRLAEREVLDEVKAAQPDLILMDSATEAQGAYACEQLKNDVETENIPVIFIHAGKPSQSLRLRCFESGAADFVSLEMDESEMLARLHAALRAKQAMGRMATLARQLQEMNAELYDRNLQIEKGLYITRQLQQSLLPPFLSEGPMIADGFSDITERFSKCHYRDEGIRITGIYLPCDMLGGDIYDVIRFSNGAIGVAIADVSGHGVPAGFITAIFKSSFYRVTHNHRVAGDVLHHLNNDLADIVKTGEYVTAVYCRILADPDSGLHVLEYSGAGHPYPIHYQAATGQIARLKENATPLVWVRNMEYPTAQIVLAPGDKVLLFTDGISEMRNLRGGLYGEEALEQLFMDQVQENSPDILEGMVRRLSDFTEGHPLEDDFSAVLIEVSDDGRLPPR